MTLNCVRSIHLLFYWILFENVMSLHRTKATLIGLFEAGRVNEWVVTEKLGDSVNKTKADAAKNKANHIIKSAKKSRLRISERSEFSVLIAHTIIIIEYLNELTNIVMLNMNRFNLLELGFAAFLFLCGCYDFVHGKNNYFIYLFLQTITFSIVGFGYVGTIV